MTVVSVCLAAVGLGPANASGQSDRAERSIPKDVRALTWNICGASWTACRNFSFGDRAAKIGEVVSWAKNDSRVSVVMLNESCGAYYGGYLKNRLNALGRGSWTVVTMKGKNINTGAHFTCAADPEKRKDAGITIAMKKFSNGNPKRLPMTFPSTGNRPKGTQGAACIKDDRNKIVACAAHLPAGKEAGQRAASARSLHDQLRVWQKKGYRTIAGGDFNAKPNASELKPLYNHNFEADTDRKGWTHQDGKGNRRKIDYLFFSDYGWDLLNGNPIYTGSQRYRTGKLSDHKILQGTVRVSS
ncbi:endonuclease/exonuclease/phosphatase family protein [Streptomyces sp. NPDC085927]|uniref:endonuclease/exonuclease/phosphatase family protein n=1 Tax=Streptomyces sp. NPDC085927 TaxID=3365738 RepID=UPI0037D5E49D